MIGWLFAVGKSVHGFITHYYLLSPNINFTADIKLYSMCKLLFLIVAKALKETTSQTENGDATI
jgi:hypothetical protein